MQRLPRGVRNNNPGNIDYNPKNKWQGQTGIETGVPNPRFARFERAEYGIRAIVKILQSYRKRGIKTPRAIAHTWAPPTENNTRAYALALAYNLNISLNDEIIWSPQNAVTLVRGIVFHENGYDPYPNSVYELGVQWGYEK